MMSVSISDGQPLEARQWALKMVTYYPKEKTSYYCLGFTDWSVVYPAVAAAREVAGMKPEDSAFIAGDMTRRALRDQYGPLIEEGIRMLETSVGIRSRLLRRDDIPEPALPDESQCGRNRGGVRWRHIESDEWIGKSIAARQAQPAPVPAVNAGNAAPPPPSSPAAHFRRDPGDQRVDAGPHQRPRSARQLLAGYGRGRYVRQKL